MALCNISHMSLTTLLLIPALIIFFFLFKYGWKAKDIPVVVSAIIMLFSGVFFSFFIRMPFLPIFSWMKEFIPVLNESILTTSSGIGHSTTAGAGISFAANFTLEILAVLRCWKPLFAWGLFFTCFYLIIKKIKIENKVYRFTSSLISAFIILFILFYPFPFYKKSFQFTEYNWSFIHYHFLCLAYVSIIFSLLYLFVKILKKKSFLGDNGSIVVLITTMWVGIHIISHSVSSTIVMIKSIYGIAPILMVAGAYFYRGVMKHGGKYYTPTVYVVIISLFAGGLWGLWSFSPGYVSSSQLNTQFSKYKLNGIVSDSPVVQDLEELLGFLDGKVKPGDFLLNYYHIPALNFLTGTRPAINKTWIWPTYPLEQRKQLVEGMISEDRIPEYAVRAYLSLRYPLLPPFRGDMPIELRPCYFKPFPSEQPINAFVQTSLP